MSKDYYQILEISPDTTEEDIKNAYHRLALNYHPNRNLSSEAKEKFQEIKEAYEFLSKPSLRDSYYRMYHIQLVKTVLRNNKISNRALDEMNLISIFRHKKLDCSVSSD
jgi:DnaJ-class molecular chaperone